MSAKRRIAVVTGAANRTGEECARKLAGQGVRVILADCDVRAGQQSRSIINQCRVDRLRRPGAGTSNVDLVICPGTDH